MTDILIILDLITTIVVVVLGIHELASVHSHFHRLKEDHFDLQVTFSRLLEVTEYNKHEIGKIKDRLGI